MEEKKSEGRVYIYGDPHGGLYVDVVKNGKRIESEAVNEIFDVAWAVERFTKEHGINKIYNDTPPGVAHIFKKNGKYTQGYRPLSSEALNRVLKALGNLRFEI